MKTKSINLTKKYLLPTMMLATAVATTSSCSDEAGINPDMPAIEQTAQPLDLQHVSGKLFTDWFQRDTEATRGAAILVNGSRAVVSFYTLNAQDPYSIPDNATVIYTDEAEGQGYFKMDTGEQITFCNKGGVFSIDHMPGYSADDDNGELILTYQNTGSITRAPGDMSEGAYTALMTAGSLLSAAASTIPIGGNLISPLIDLFFDMLGEEYKPRNIFADVSTPTKMQPWQTTSTSTHTSPRTAAKHWITTTTTTY